MSDIIVEIFSVIKNDQWPPWSSRNVMDSASFASFPYELWHRHHHRTYLYPSHDVKIKSISSCLIWERSPPFRFLHWIGFIVASHVSMSLFPFLFMAHFQLFFFAASTTILTTFVDSFTVPIVLAISFCYPLGWDDKVQRCSKNYTVRSRYCLGAATNRSATFCINSASLSGLNWARGAKTGA